MPLSAFGWTDTHLHRFGSGPEYYAHDTEYYLSPFEVTEGEVGVPEEQVRLDEVLVDAADTLFYAYDFGDDWQHVIKLETVLPRDDSAPRAVCTGGRRNGPAEDCGGVYAFELIAAATDPAGPDHADAVADFARMYGDDVDPHAIGTTPFDIDEINQALTGLGADDTEDEIGLPKPLEDLLDAVRPGADRRHLRRLIADSALDEPTLGWTRVATLTDSRTRRVSARLCKNWR